MGSQGDVQNHLDNIVTNFREGQAVLVCCNQVARAQAIHDILYSEIYQLSDDDVMLLHGRFNGKDRADKEKRLAEYVGVGVKNRRPVIVVATQVVEVSLDVDFDVLYTDPAPLSALIQRFGRVNRGKRFPTRPVHVFREPSDDKGAKPYEGNQVRRSLEVLEQYSRDKPIDESQVTTMLADIYQDETILQDWLTIYNAAVSRFTPILRGMRPYESADEQLWHKFYELFDGRQVLPSDCANDFYDALKEGGFLAASGYLVNVSQGQYYMMKKNGLVLGTDEYGFIEQVDVPYTSETGLDIAAALQQRDEDV